MTAHSGRGFTYCHSPRVRLQDLQPSKLVEKHGYRPKIRVFAQRNGVWTDGGAYVTLAWSQDGLSILCKPSSSPSGSPRLLPKEPSRRVTTRWQACMNCCNSSNLCRTTSGCGVRLAS